VSVSVVSASWEKRASHRGHGGHRGGFKIGAKGLRVNRGDLCEKQPKRREHRTEVTEVTEGGKIGGERSAVNSGDFVRETAETKRASHRGHGGHRGGFKIGGERSAGEPRGFLCEKKPKGRKHRTEVTEGFKIGSERSAREPRGFLCEKKPKGRKHRTEVTEGFKIGSERSAREPRDFRCESEEGLARRPDTDTATGGSRSRNGRKPHGKSQSRDSTKPCRPGIPWRFRTHRPNWRNPLGRRRRSRDHCSTKLCHPSGR
jgi:hypothetical protein